MRVQQIRKEGTNNMKRNTMSVSDIGEAKNIIHEMVSAGATKTAITKAVGVSDMTILSVSQGKTKTFRKLKQLQRVYDRWKAGTLDLSGKRRKRVVEAPVAVETHAQKQAPAGKKAPVKKSKVARRPVPTVKAKRIGGHSLELAVSVETTFQLPEVTEEMIVRVEEQIVRLQAEARFMKDLVALRKKYGQ